MISLKAPFNPNFGSSPHPGLIKRADLSSSLLEIGEQLVIGGALGTSWSSSRQTSDLAGEMGCAERGALRVRVTKRGVMRCRYEPGLLHSNQCSLD